MNCAHLGTLVPGPLFRAPTVQTLPSLIPHSRGPTSYRSQSLAKSYARPGCHGLPGTEPGVILDLASSARPPACYCLREHRSGSCCRRRSAETRGGHRQVQPGRRAWRGGLPGAKWTWREGQGGPWAPRETGADGLRI